MILLNNPQNVPGRVFDREELEGIAAIAKKHNLLVIRYTSINSLPWFVSLTYAQ